MNPWCRRRQKRLTADIAVNRPISAADRQHLDQCPLCNAWYARQEQLSGLLAQVRRPEPGPYLSAEVMAFVYRREESRQRDAKNRLRRGFSWLPILRREAWPMAFCALAMVWGLWINPALAGWEDRPQVNVAGWVEAIPDRLDKECAEIQRRLAERLASIIQSIEWSSATESDQTSGVSGGRPVIT